jgi:pimeloyl-ACP methyl ester carboxylesterase
VKKIAFFMIFFMTLTMIITSSSFYKPGSLKDEKRLRYFNYGQIFSKSEKNLVALNNGIIQFFEAAYETQGLIIPNQTGQDPYDTRGRMVHALYFSLGLEYDLRDELKRIQAPPLVIHEKKDVMPSPANREYEDFFSEGRLAIIPEAAHFPFLETPARFAELVGGFLSKF